MPNIWQDINNAAADTVYHVRQSLVQIKSTEGNIGAGTIWHSDGLIITNAHVVMNNDQARDLEVVLQNGDHYPATVLVADATLDIAALAIQARDLPTITVGSSANLQVGQWLIAIGHPWGVLDAITAGVVIGTGNNLPELADKRDWIALDMKMRPGHSGGPLFNQAGEIVGINTMIQGPEVSYAVPVDVVTQFLHHTIGSYHPQNVVPQAVSTSDNSIIV